MNWPAKGIHENIPFSDYRADDITQADNAHTVKGKAVSKSMIVDFMDDPAAWKASPPKAQTKAMKAGSLFDCLLTTPAEVSSRYVVSPYADFRSNESKAWKTEMESAGAQVIKGSEMQTARAQLMAVMAHPCAAKLINGSKKQVAFRHPTKYGFDSKGLIDIVPACGGILADTKTCEPRALESKRALQKHILDWGYHIQAGAYCEGYSIAGGIDVTQFKFIFVTSTAPFRVAVIDLPFCAISFGSDLYRAGMAKFAECIQADRWPSIWDGEVSLDLPSYAYLGEEEG